MMENQANLQLQSTTVAELPRQADAAPSRVAAPRERPRVAGKFLFVGTQKLWIKGVTYGTFKPDDKGGQFPQPEQVAQDFRQMAANGINAIASSPPSGASA